MKFSETLLFLSFFSHRFIRTGITYLNPHCFHILPYNFCLWDVYGTSYLKDEQGIWSINGILANIQRDFAEDLVPVLYGPFRRILITSVRIVHALVQLVLKEGWLHMKLPKWSLSQKFFFFLTLISFLCTNPTFFLVTCKALQTQDDK